MAQREARFPRGLARSPGPGSFAQFVLAVNVKHIAFGGRWTQVQLPTWSFAPVPPQCDLTSRNLSFLSSEIAIITLTHRSL